MRGGFLRRLDDRVLPVLVGSLERAAARVVRRGVVLGWLAVGLGVALIGAVIAGGQPQTSGARSVPRSVTKVGPVEGTLIIGYVAGAKRELVTLAGAGSQPVFAFVSLAGYGTPAQVAALADGYAVSKVHFRVPLAGVQTEIRSVDVATELRADVEAQMRRDADRSRTEATAAESQAARLTGSSASEQTLRAFYADSGRVLRLQAREFRSLCACVYSFVVRASPQALIVLAARTGVRVVDPAPEIISLDGAVFLPLLPEQAVTVQPPADSRRR